MRMIIPLVQKHCINGIDKEDAENIRQIPELDERVTALEQSGVKFIDIKPNTISDFNPWKNKIIENNTLKYDMIINLKVDNGIFRISSFLQKGTSINYGVSFTYIDRSTERFSIYNDQLQIKELINASDNPITFRRYKLNIDSTTLSITATDLDTVSIPISYIEITLIVDDSEEIMEE